MSEKNVEPHDASVKDLTQGFADATSLHGLPRVYSSKSLTRKIIWGLVFFGCFVGFCWQVTALTLNYFEYPISVTTEVKTRLKVDFPAVTVCNMNMLKKSLLMGTRFENLTKVDKRLSDIYGTSATSNSQTTPPAEMPQDPENEDPLSGADFNEGSTTEMDTEDDGTSTIEAEDTTDGITYVTTEDPYDETIDTTQEDIATEFITTEASAGDATTDYDYLTTETSRKKRSVGKRRPKENEHKLPEQLHKQMKPLDGSAHKHAHPYSNNAKGESRRRKRQADSYYDDNYEDDGDEYDSDPYDDYYDNYYDNGDDYYPEERFEFEDTGFSEIEPNDYFGFLQNSQTQDLSDLVGIVVPTTDEMDSYGHTFEDFVLQCSFDKKNCSNSDWKKLYNSQYGNCYTWNFGYNNTIKSTSRFGSRYGLRLTLNAQADEYIGLLSHTVGARVTVHSHNVMPFPEDQGVSASVGRKTGIGVQMQNIKRKPHPFPTNCTYGTHLQSNYEGDYSVLSCMMSCLQNKIKTNCKCVDKIVHNQTACDITNTTQEKCRQRMYHLFDEAKLGCDCPQACEELVYGTTISGSEWPSNQYSPYLLQKLEGGSPVSDIKQNLVRVHVYFETLAVHTIEEVPSYTWDNLLADIGGTMGMFIGISICTAFEIVELLMEIGKLVVGKMTNKNKVTSLK
ncbi:unnamed protein product [Owenia fusiformis]|uniref:Uncharacterized protein n=1 Tax=Owenia fusiformis TaxID=6347 RepID=A0A8J1UAY3_OWEFU|nr:unnamed protein product [Owenia fusiformis]